MAAARLIYGRHWKGATGSQRGRRMLHLETNCRSIEPTQPKSPAGEMESDQLSGSYGFSRLTLFTARRSRAVYCGQRTGQATTGTVEHTVRGAAHGTVPSKDRIAVGDKKTLN